MDERRIGAEERGMDIEVGEEQGRVGDEIRKEIVIERAGEEMQTAGRSWADIVGLPNLSQGAVPLPHTRFGAGVARPNSVVLHTQAFKDITVREVMDAVLKCVKQDTIKCVQQVPGPRYRLTFPSFEYEQLFLDQPFHLRGERVIARELDIPTLLVKVLYAPSEISNQTIAATLAKYGKIVKADREMYRD
ncbi:Hypothetical predicted protein [Paramuricea clavata]|uniref:Uncharacterized protein n=1 Tax=Paramuricea clavata TaxID=317549 RepID=A0A7D9D947_PARCT|nr:Hypothetical predicted protein [Paramuricea clavata]